MSWIKMREDLHEDPAVLKMAAKLGTRPEHVVGYLHRFWGWVSRNVSLDIRDKCPSGSVTGVPLLSLESALNVPGFLSLLTDAGWLIYSEDGDEPVITIPKFDRHLSEGAKQRAINAEKKRVQRAKAVAPRPDAVPNVQGQMSPMSRDKCPSKQETREDKRRKEKKINTKEGAPLVFSQTGGKQKFDPESLELPFEGQSFAAAWQAWCRHRVEKRKPLTPTSAAAQLEQFAEWGESRSIAAIRHTIRQGWQGLREPETTNGATPKLSIAEQLQRRFGK